MDELLERFPTACSVEGPIIEFIDEVKPSYEEIIETIKKESLNIKLDYSEKGDGRLISALKEPDFLNILSERLLKHPGYTVEIPKIRFWFDIRVNSIPINLKITSGGTDNAFNKIAIIYSICGIEIKNKNMNYNKWYKFIKENPKKKIRDKSTEYHYLVIHKNSKDILLKSIFDISKYNDNPCNDLQINWDNEFKNIDYKINDEDFLKKALELVQTVQKSVIKNIQGMLDFASLTLTEDF